MQTPVNRTERLQRLRLICARIDAGHYDRPRLIRATAEAIIARQGPGRYPRLVEGGQGHTGREVEEHASSMVMLWILGAAALGLCGLAWLVLRCLT